MRLVRLGREEHVLLLTFHHLVFDGWSFGVFFAELEASYAAHLRGKAPSLTRPAAQYADFAVWQRQRLRGELLDDLLAYWRQRFSGYQGLLELPADRSRPPLPSFRGGRRRRALPGSLVAALKSLARAHAASLFMVLLAAFAALLQRLTGRDDLAVGCPISARERSELEGSIGFFVNTLALRVDLAGNPGFATLVARVAERGVGGLRPPRAAVRAAGGRAAAAALHQPPPARPGLLRAAERSHVGPAPGRHRDAAAGNGEVDGKGRSDRGGLSGGLGSHSAPRLQRRPLRRRHGRASSRALETLLEGRRRPAASALGASAPRQGVRPPDDGRMERPRGGVPARRLHPEAVRSPGRALAGGGGGGVRGRGLTYRELNRQANRLAHHLGALGVRSEAAVGLCMERSPEMVAGLLGILKAGCFYLPLDPAYPEERLAFMLEDSRARVVITERALMDRLPQGRATSSSSTATGRGSRSSRPAIPRTGRSAST